MELKKLDHALTVCKIASEQGIDLGKEFYFIGKTDEEYSLVCLTEDAPVNTVARDDGWKGFRIQGVLDFSMIGVLSKLSSILAEHQIGIFVVSTFNTDCCINRSRIVGIPRGRFFVGSLFFGISTRRTLCGWYQSSLR